MRQPNEVADEWADRHASEKVFNHSIAAVQCNKRKQDELEKAQALAKSPYDMTGKYNSQSNKNQNSNCPNYRI
jgi:hypothetical protein